MNRKIKIYLPVFLLLIPNIVLGQDSDSNVVDLLSAIFLLFIGIPLLIAYLKWKYKGVSNKRYFFKSIFSGSFLWMLFSFFLIALIVNILLTKPIIEPEKTIQKQRLEKLERSITYSLSGKRAYRTLEKNYLNPYIHYRYIELNYQTDLESEKNNKIRTYYLKQLNSNTDYRKQTAYFGLTIFNCKIYQIDSALFFYNKLKSPKNTEYVNYAIAEYYLNNHDSIQAIPYLKNEVSTFSMVREDAFSGLLDIADSLQNYSIVLPYLKDWSLLKLTDGNFAREVAFQYRNSEIYLKAIVVGFLQHVNFRGFISALLIAFVWFFFLFSIDVFEKENYWRLGAIFLTGSLFSFFSFPLYDYLDISLNFNLNGDPFNDLQYCIFGIGGIEELVKIIPLLFLLGTKQLNEPVDYLIYASCSALGFAFVENNLYFTDYSPGIIHSRALISVLSHMTDSSIVAYGFVLSKYKFNKNFTFHIPLCFLIAITLHGMYDFLLISSQDMGWFIIVWLILMLFSIRAWSILLNNSINNSGFFSFKLIESIQKLKNILVIILTSILVFEYFLLAMYSGSYYANHSLVKSVFTGSFLILFISSNLSKVDLVKGYWKKIKIWNLKGFSPYLIFNPVLLLTFILSQNRIVPKNYIGKYISLERWLENKSLAGIFETVAYGEIIDRKIIIASEDSVPEDEDTNWFLVKLDSPMNWDSSVKDLLFIGFEDDVPDPVNEKDISVFIYAIPDFELINRPQIYKTDLKYYQTVCFNLEKENINKYLISS